MPSVLIELGYITNSQEEQFLKSDSGRKQMATSIYNAFTKYKRDYDRKMGALKNGQATAPILSNLLADTEPEQAVQAPEQPLPPAGSEADIARRKQTNRVETPKQQTAQAKQGRVYKIQILTSPSKLSQQSKRFKGYKPVSYYIENGTYKYTYGESTQFEEIRRLRRKVAKDFKDAFIVEFQNGEKIK